MNVNALKALTQFIYELKYDESQPRDDSGKWTSGGGGSGSGDNGEDGELSSSGGITPGRKQPEVSGDSGLISRTNSIIDRLPDALVPPYKSLTVDRTGGISRTNNNKIAIGDMPGMDSDAVLQHEILHTVAPKYKVDYPKKVSDAGEGKWGESTIDYSEPSQNVTEDFVASAHAYLSETRGFDGPTFLDAKRLGALNDNQIAQRRKYFKGLIGD